MLYILKKEEFSPDKDSIMEKLRISEDDMDEFNQVYNHCMEIAAPKFLFDKREITEMTDDTVFVQGIPIKSAIAVKNMNNTGYAYPYVATCGHEIYEYYKSTKDPFVGYWIDLIMEQLLYITIKMMREVMNSYYDLNKTSSVNPGSTVDWHISGQKELFSMLEPDISKTGIVLTDTFLMLPHKSASGIIHLTKEDYINCQDCKRKNCPNRKKKYSVQNTD